MAWYSVMWILPVPSFLFVFFQYCKQSYSEHADCLIFLLNIFFLIRYWKGYRVNIVVLDLLISTVKLSSRKVLPAYILTGPGFINQRCIVEFSCEIGVRF